MTEFLILKYSNFDLKMKFNSLIPEFSVSDLSQSLDFYVNKLGFVIEFERPDDKFAFISYQGSQIMLEQDHETGWLTAEISYPRGRGINFEIETDNLAEIIARITKHQIPYFRPPQENWYKIKNGIQEGVKELLIQDPDGYLWRFQQYLGERTI
jgi:catechol 2,3-dioxygenase-like lactoylglutathione lyase family enzyme